MITTSKMNKINEYFIAFFTEHDGDSAEELKKAWEDEKFQKALNLLISKHTKPKVKKDPKKPKRGRSAYILFGSEMRAKVVADNPEMKNTDIMKKMGELWHELEENDPDEHARYQELAKEDKARYEEEMKDYVPSDEEAGDGKKAGKAGKAGKAKKDPNAPRGARNAYILYGADNRARIAEENPEMSGKEVTAEIAAQWGSLEDDDPDEYARYQELAKEDKERAVREKAEYEGKGSAKGAAKGSSKGGKKKSVKVPAKGGKK